MPPLPPAPSVIQIRLKGTFGSTKWNNIQFVQYAGTPPTSAQLSTFATAIANAWAANLASLAIASVILTEVDAVDLTSVTSASATVTTNKPGTRAGTAFTAQVAMVGSWIANLRYRGGHFRNYFPFGVQADAGTVFSWTPAFQTAAQTALRAYRTAVNGLTVGTAPVVMVGVSYRTAHAMRPSPVVVPLNDVAVHGRIDTQRRRLGKEIP